MTAITVGFWCIYRTALHASDRVEAIAALLTDKRWPWQPQLIRPTQRPGHPLYPWPPGKIPMAKLKATIADVMRSDRAEDVFLTSSRQERLNHAWVHFDTGQPELIHEGIPFPYRAIGTCRTEAMPAGKSLDEWLEVVHELVRAVDAIHGVIWALDDERPISVLQWGSGKEYPSRPQDHPYNESVRVNRVRRELGTRWIRPPAWGTYLAPEHVAAVGGRVRVVEQVRPPVVREVGSLLYLQMSAQVADAIAPETIARRRALAEVLAPIVVPPIG